LIACIEEVAIKVNNDGMQITLKKGDFQNVSESDARQTSTQPLNKEKSE
jgi:hypothetical protein